MEQKKGYLGLREQQEPRRERGEGECCLGTVGGRRVSVVQAAGPECLDGQALRVHCLLREVLSPLLSDR